jgi:hypothetical protein
MNMIFELQRNAEVTYLYDLRCLIDGIVVFEDLKYMSLRTVNLVAKIKVY